MGGSQYFSVPVFLIALREVLEAGIILSVLLAFVEQLIRHSPASKALASKGQRGTYAKTLDGVVGGENLPRESAGIVTEQESERRLLKRLRIQIFAGTFVGLLIAFAIGAAFLAVYYTSLNNLYGKSEELWEGIFSLIACVMIFIMGLAVLRMAQSRANWRVKLSRAFEAEARTSGDTPEIRPSGRLRWAKALIAASKATDAASKSSKYLLFFLPAITVLREGLEAFVFVGGVSLGQPAKSIPIAAIVGILAGALFSYVIYASARRLSPGVFAVVSAAFLFLVGAGLLAKATWFFTLHNFIKLIGGDVGEEGSGPGTFPIDNYIWHLDYGNPDYKVPNSGWSIFAGLFGWNNTGYVQTVALYISYWLAASVCMVYMKWSEGRCTVLGVASRSGKERMENRERGRIENEKAETEKMEATSAPANDPSAGDKVQSSQGQRQVNTSGINEIAT